MKIEKLNENQIRCTLTKEDLASRQLKLSELAYGTEKAKRLFREMMQQANFQFGFEAEDIPLMIEAIPMNAECVVLLITKVEDPEELDTRFSHFSPSESDLEDEEDDFYDSDGDDMMDMLQQMQTQGSQEYGPIENIVPKDAVPNHSRMFFFHTLSDVMDAAAQTGSSCPCPNTLYTAPGGKGYVLTIHVGNAALDIFNRICNTLTEYGSIRRSYGAGRNFLEEHCEVLLPENALQKLCQG